MNEMLIVPFLVFLVIFIFAIIILIVVFWIWILIDALKRKFKTDGEKIAWVLVVIFLHLLGAIVYYFVVKYNKRK